MRNQLESSTGFTLMELMVTIAIAGILLGVAIPSFTSIISSNRLTTYANELVTALNLARSEAIKRGGSVTVRKVDSNSCTKTGVNWNDGWDVFTDVNNNGTCDTSDVLIRTYAPFPSFYTLRGNYFFINFIRYKPDGSSNVAGSFVLCDNSDDNNLPEKNTSKLITVTSSGRVHMGIDADMNGIPEKDNGTEIVSCTVSPF